MAGIAREGKRIEPKAAEWVESFERRKIASGGVLGLLLAAVASRTELGGFPGETSVRFLDPSASGTRGDLVLTGAGRPAGSVVLIVPLLSTCVSTSAPSALGRILRALFQRTTRHTAGLSRRGEQATSLSNTPPHRRAQADTPTLTPYRCKCRSFTRTRSARPATGYVEPWPFSSSGAWDNSSGRSRRSSCSRPGLCSRAVLC